MNSRVLLILLVIPVWSLGQNTFDALRFSQRGISGTARYSGLSGAMGALGADASAVSVNPGGLGLFRKGQANLAISSNTIGTETSHYGNTENSTFSTGRVSNLAVVLSGPFDYSPWKYGNVIFGYQNKDNFNSSTFSRGANNESSYLDQYFVDIIDEPGLFLEDIEAYFPFGAGLAWGAKLIDTANGSYYSTNPFYGQEQSKQVNHQRGLGEYYFGFGGNYMDKLFLGATLGFSSLRFSSNTIYKERFEPGQNPYGLEEWSQAEELTISGSGFNFKIGGIYWLTEVLRLGLAFNSKEYFRLTDKYYSTIEAIWDIEETYAYSPDGYNEYTFESPYRVIASVGLVRSLIGALNLDVEYVDFTSMKFVTSPTFGTDFTSINNEIQETFQPAVNLRLGGELLYGPFYFRGGGAYWSNPYIADNDRRKYRVSGGIGWRKKRFFMDLSYAYEWQNNWNVPIHYAENVNLQSTIVDNHEHQIIATIGVKFQEE